MTAAAVNARGTTLLALTGVGVVVMLLGLTCHWHALPQDRGRDRGQEPQVGSPWRAPVASGVVTLAMALAAGPLLVQLRGLHEELWLPVGCAFVLVQAAVLARLDLALGRLGRRPRGRFLLSLATSAVSTTAMAVLVSLGGGPGLPRWPAFVNAGIVLVATGATSLLARATRPRDVGQAVDWGGSAATWQSVPGDRVEPATGDLGGQVGAERLAPPVRG